MNIGEVGASPTKYVQLEHGLEPFQPMLLEALVETKSCIVDEDGQPDVLRVQRGDQLPYALWLRKITGLDDDVDSPSVADAAGDVFQDGMISGRENERIAPPGEIIRHGGAQPSRSPGYECPVEFHMS